MCGIAGGWIRSGDHGALSPALDCLVHRGPDDSGIYTDGPLFLGMRRLSIIDLQGGHQPVQNEDGSVVVVYNGEIYNYLELASELRKKGHIFQTVSDTEVLVHLYEEKGIEMCHLLRGMFAFALWDQRIKCLFLARDRFGKKPLYYSKTSNGEFVFGSEIKAVRAMQRKLRVPTSLNAEAIYDYLSLGVVPQPKTIFSNIESLPAGSFLRIDDRNFTVQSYWNCDIGENKNLTYEESVERARELIAESVILRLRSDVPLGVFLSGGMDSTIIAYEASRRLGEQLQTFTVAVEDPAINESDVARRTAAVLGVQNTVLPLKVSPAMELQQLLRHYDQPFADASAIPSMAVSRLARQHVKVILNGDGGDEMFGGYRRYLAASLADQVGWVPSQLATLGTKGLGWLQQQRRSMLGFGARFARGIGTQPGTRYLIWTTDLLLENDKLTFWKGDRVRPTEEWIESLLPDANEFRTQRIGDIRINLVSDLLVKMDIATMASSLEGRSPFLDHLLAEFALSIPDSYLIRKRRLKAILKDAYKNALPAEVISGRKRGFEIPLRSWLDGELKTMVMDALGTPAAKVTTYVDSAFVQDLIQNKIMHDRNRPNLIYALLVLEIWLQNNQ